MAPRQHLDCNHPKCKRSQELVQIVQPRNTRFAWAGGTFFPVVLYVCCVGFWFWREKGYGLHTHVLLRVQNSCGVVLVFWLRREIVFGVTYIHTQCTIQLCCCVSFLVMWEIVLKMRTCFYKKILLGYFNMIRQPMCVFYTTYQHSFTLYL